MLGPATLRTHARKVYHDPDGILKVPARKLKEQQQINTFNALWKKGVENK